MKRLRAWLGAEFGVLGLTSVALFAGAAAFYGLGLRPIEERNRRLDMELERLHRRGDAARAERQLGAVPTAKLAAFYGYFERNDGVVDWLAKLYGISRGAGTELSSGDYRLAESRQRLQRYQLTFPVAGSYPQVRGFIEEALAEIPVLSLDQVSFRRRRVNEMRIEAEVVFTLHLVRP